MHLQFELVQTLERTLLLTSDPTHSQGSVRNVIEASLDMGGLKDRLTQQVPIVDTL